MLPAHLPQAIPGEAMNSNPARTILIADDDEDIRAMLSIFLRDEGYRVLEAANGREALEVAQHARPDLILMDLNMPVMDGNAAAEQIRRRQELNDVPIVFISAHGDLGIKLFSDLNKFGAGPIEYLTKSFEVQKPFGDMAQLAELIADLLNRGHLTLATNPSEPERA
jgi:CheY-like chemotaxis protein